ncbi:MAG: DUF6790 family protein [Methanoregulaceae archaeon]
MDPAFFFVTLATLIAALHLHRERQELSRLRALEILLVWFLVVAVGLNGIVTGLAQVLMDSRLTTQTGALQVNYEIAGANLAIGTLGILSCRYQDNFRLAPIFASLIFGWCYGIGRIVEQFVRADFSVYSTAQIFLYQFGMPVLLIAIWALQKREIRKLSDIPSSA